MNQILLRVPGGLGVLLLLQVCVPSLSFAQSTAFTYQGRLATSGAAASGNFDLRFALFDSGIGGSQQGVVVTNLATSISNGLFTVVLDFGNQFPGADRWLEISIRTNGPGPFIALSPRQPITSTPYAVKSAAVDATGIVGTISPASIGAGNFTGTFSGDGTGLTNLPAAQLTGTVPDAALAKAWKLNGNAGTDSNANFLGTVDNQPLELRVNATRTLRLDMATNPVFPSDILPNIVAGFQSNSVLNGAAGVTIAGGGGPQWYGPTTPNQVGGTLSTIGGGIGHTIYGVVSAIAGGERGYIGTNGYNAFIGGGAGNTILAGDSSIGGGRGNTIYDGYNSVIAGGSYNSIQTNAYYSVISGGNNNSIFPNAQYCFVAGGYYNNIFPNANYSVISGGNNNSISTNAQYSVVAGGYYNSVSPNANYSFIAGGYNNAILPGASYSFAAGYQARAAYPGTFVWSDSSGGSFFSTADNQFLIRSMGGVGINTATPGAPLEVRSTNSTGLAFRFGYYTGGAGNLIAGPSRIGIATDDMVERLSIRQGTGNVGVGLIAPVYSFQLGVDSAAKPNGGSWANSSDARIKRNIAPMTNALARLTQLRGVNFEWINPEDHAGQTGTQGGFIAQEIEKVFPKWTAEVEAAEHDRSLTPDGKIKSLSLPFEFDALVVEAIKEQQSMIHARDEEIRELKKRLEALEQKFLQMKVSAD